MGGEVGRFGFQSESGGTLKVNNNVLSREFKHIVEIDFARERREKKIANIFTGAVWFSGRGDAFHPEENFRESREEKHGK